MKLELLAYLDYQNASLEEQLDLTLKLNIKSFLFRQIAGQSIVEMSEETFQQTQQEFTKKKVKVTAVDPLIPSYDLYQPEEKKQFDTLLDLAIKRAKSLRTEYIYYVIPKFIDVTTDTDIIMTHIKEHLSQIKKAKLEVLIKPESNHKANTYRFILNALKDDRIKINYDPVYFHLNKESNVTAYRLLREFIGIFVAADIDQLGNPRLVGLGKLEMTQMFKKLFKNKYNGYVVLDSKLPEVIQRASSYRWHQTLFSQRKRLERKIFNDFIERSDGYSLYEVIHYQMVILNVIFFNKKID